MRRFVLGLAIAVLLLVAFSLILDNMPIQSPHPLWPIKRWMRVHRFIYLGF